MLIPEKSKIISSRNVFVYGMTGCGKDTVSNWLKDEYNYLKLRIAKTIKQVICENHNISFDELEILKRTNPEIREEHHKVSNYLSMQSSLNRCKLLCNGKAMDYEHIPFHEYMPKVICDTRTIFETEIFLKQGWTGIFLTRTTNEYKNSEHYTEQNILFNGELRKIYSKYINQIMIIENSGNNLKLDFDFYHITDGTPEDLFDTINLLVSKL